MGWNHLLAPQYLIVYGALLLELISRNSCSAEGLPEGLVWELPNADNSVANEDQVITENGDLDDLQRQLEALNAI